MGKLKHPAIARMGADEIIEAIDALLDAEGENAGNELLAEYYRVLEAQVEAPLDIDASYRDFMDRYGDLMPMRPQKKRRLWTKPVILVAVLCIILTMTVTASLYEMDVFDGFINWAGEAFRVGEASGNMSLQERNADGLRSLEEALFLHGMQYIAPSWIPARFTITGLYRTQEDFFTEYLAQYQAENGESLIARVVILYGDSALTSIEMIPGTDDVVEHNGQQFAIVDNYDILNVYWGTTNYECTLFGPISREEAIKMIETVGK